MAPPLGAARGGRRRDLGVVDPVEHVPEPPGDGRAADVASSVKIHTRPTPSTPSAAPVGEARGLGGHAAADVVDVDPVADLQRPRAPPVHEPAAADDGVVGRVADEVARTPRRRPPLAARRTRCVSTLTPSGWPSPSTAPGARGWPPRPRSSTAASPTTDRRRPPWDRRAPGAAPASGHARAAAPVRLGFPDLGRRRQTPPRARAEGTGGGGDGRGGRDRARDRRGPGRRGSPAGAGRRRRAGPRAPGRDVCGTAGPRSRRR